jgi:hypothetical protein
MSETVAHTQTANQAIVNLAAMSLSAAPGLTEAERTARFQTVALGAMGFQPADTAQTILASLILGHHLTIMDGFRELASLTVPPVEAARTRSGTVAQTKVVLQLLREMRVERADALARAVGSEPAQEPGADAAFDAAIAKMVSTHTGTLAMLENTDAMTPEAASEAWEALSQATPSPAISIPGAANPAPALVTGSRAQRRAMMKRNGGFKRNG